MCGRTCLTLDPEQILCACKYIASQPKSGGSNDKIKKKNNGEAKDSDDKSCDNLTPEWRAEYNCGRIYKPSYNIAPTDITPVLVSADHFADNKSEETNRKEQQKRVVVPMMWGMIPFWHKGDYRKHGLTTNNCRLEHMLDSKLYRGPFRRGQRCVVLCEGFYEWNSNKPKPSEREAYFICVPQDKNVKIYDKSTWSPTGVKLLKMAGLFDVWEDENGDKIYSYSIITFASSKIMSWLHYRMPAILETEQQIDDWLDYKRVSDEVALATLRPAIDLLYHRVSKLVNNSHNKSDQCNKPIELTEKPKMNKTMMFWCTVRKKREEQIDKEIEESDRSSDDEKDDDIYCKRPHGVVVQLQPPKRRCLEEIKKQVENMQNVESVLLPESVSEDKETFKIYGLETLPEIVVECEEESDESEKDPEKSGQESEKSEQELKKEFPNFHKLFNPLNFT